METEQGALKPRISLRKIQPMKKGLATENTTVWIWVGCNPVGQDWSFGSVRLFTLEHAIKQYARKLGCDALPAEVRE
jgi:hypothetical protein